MPTLLRVGNLRFVVYPNDHSPAHVHVVGPDWEVIVELERIQLREVLNCPLHEATRVLELVARHQSMLLSGWRKIHG